MPPHPSVSRLISCVASAAVIAALVVGGVPGAASASAPSDVPAAVPPVSDAETVPGRIVVSWTDTSSASQRAEARLRHGLRTEESFDAVGVEVVSVPAHAVERITAALNLEPGVASAEPDYVMAPATNDPGYSQLWGLHNTGQNGGTADVDVDAPEAWATTRGSSNVIVAVIDTGIDITHPDLAGNIWRNPGEIAGNGIDDDRNGYVDDVNGWDFYNNDRTVYDDPVEDTHGTHVAGTIAALADNGQGVAGVAPNVKIMPLKFLGGTDSTGSSGAAAAAVHYARTHGATVINASWGGGGGSTLKNAITAATNTVVVAAAGNEGLNMDSATPQFPAAWTKDTYAMPTVVSVASVHRTGSVSSFSNYGLTTVDVGAPGGSIISTLPAGLYGTMSGTSMATPHASGVAALVSSADRKLSGAQLAAAINGGAVALGSLSGKTSTGGLVNGPASLAMGAGVQASPPATTTSPPATTAPSPSPAPGPSPEPSPEPPPTDPAEPPPYDGTGARSLDWACPGVTESGFTDVPSGSTHAPGVGCAGAWNVFTGSSTGTFGPSSSLTRGQLASVLVRAIEQAVGSPLPTGRDHFVDDQDSVHRAAIDKLAELGIVTGLDGTNYGPGVSVSRGQFATMLARTYRHLAGELRVLSDVFGDDNGSVHELAINGLAGLGIVAGAPDGRFQPATALSRAQSATLVARLLDALVEARVVARPGR